MVDTILRLESHQGDTYHPLNNPPWRTNEPAPCDVSWFQRELERIGGREPNGLPHYRVVWGQDFGQARMRDRYQDRWVPRYIHMRKAWLEEEQGPSGLAVMVERDEWIGTPRFFVEAWIPPAIALRSGTAKGKDADGDTFAEYKPIDGEWYPMFEVNIDHEAAGHRCCRWFESKGMNCHGWYREPGQQDVDYVEMLWQEWQRDTRGLRPDQSLQGDQPESVWRKAWQMEHDRLEALKRDDYFTRHFFNTHKARLSDDPSVQSHGKYHFLSGGAKPNAADFLKILRG